MSKLSNYFKKTTGVSLTGGLVAAAGAFAGNPAIVAGGLSLGSAQAGGDAPEGQSTAAQYTPSAPGATGQRNTSRVYSEDWNTPGQRAAPAGANDFGIGMLGVVAVLFLLVLLIVRR